MLRGRSPWGLGGAVYLLVRLFVRVCSFVDVRSSMLSVWGSGDAIECCASMLDRTGALIGERRSGCYCEGVLSGGFRDLTIPCENFSPPPGPIALLCDVSALALGLNFKTQVRSRHHVQVQSPFSTGQSPGTTILTSASSDAIF